MWFKKNIDNLVRKQTSQNRDIINGIVLDRNEKVSYFDNKTITSIKNELSKYDLNTIPETYSLYKAISKFHKTQTKNIYITQGITECMQQIMFSCVKQNEEVILMDPSYPMYEVLCKLNNIKFKLWKFNKNFQLKIEDLKKLITKKTKILFLVNPNLPIEYEFDKKIKKEISKICNKKNILIVYDEAYHHFGAKSEVNNAPKSKNLIVMRTFSKAWGLSGIRLGYMVANKKIIRYVSKCRSLVETNALSQQIGLWALKNKYILNNHIKEVRAGEIYLKKNLKKLGYNFHGGKITNAILIKLKNDKLTSNLKNYLRKKKVYVRTDFNHPISNYVRISLCSPKKLSIFFKYFKTWHKKLS